MKLELKHLAPYLPYFIDVQWLREDDNKLIKMKLVMGDYPFLINKHKAKPILKPLHDLTRGELEKQGYWHHIDWLTYELQTSKRNNGLKGLEKHINDAPYEMIQYLFSKHYDVFGLIDKGLAYSYSDVQSTSNEG